MFSNSDEVYDVSISLNYILLSVTDNFGLGNEPKSKETMVNYFALRHHQSIEEYTRENGEAVKQSPESYVLLLYLLLKLPGMTAYPTVFPNVLTSSDKRRKLKRKVILNSWLNLLFF